VTPVCAGVGMSLHSGGDELVVMSKEGDDEQAGDGDGW
jgi:hypothetical protein